MAPEVALNETYSLSADVYSIGIVLWQILALEFPFAILWQHHDQVLIGTDRPPISSSWSQALSFVLNKSWAPNPLERKKISVILTASRQEATCCQTYSAVQKEQTSSKLTSPVRHARAAKSLARHLSLRALNGV